MNTIYVNAQDCILVKEKKVLLKDIVSIQGINKSNVNQIGNIPIYTFKHDNSSEIIVSITTIIDLILQAFPETNIVNLGETDCVVKYEPKSKREKYKEIFFTFFLCIVAFIGGGYTIMAYNTDIGAKELFNYLSMLFLGDSQKGTFCLSITYAIGLTFGLILFFNHLGNKKLTKEPTPLEIQMRLYERDVYSTLIKDGARRNIDI